MENTKLILVVGLPGRTLVKEENIDEANEVFTVKNVEYKKNGKTVRENITVKMRGCVPAEQRVNISKETYEAFQSTTAPMWAKRELWNKMTQKQKLEANLTRHAEALGGWLIDYTILED